MTEDQLFIFLRQMCVVLVAARVLGETFRWFGQPPIAGEILVRLAEVIASATNPHRMIAEVVATALASVAALVVVQAGLLGPTIDHPLVRWALDAVAVVLLVRAVGDFRLVGFFKKVTGSRFARLDTMVFSPLCVVLGLGLLAVASA